MRKRCTSPDDIAHAAKLACILEVSAEKPGNITPRHDFADATYEDMLRSALAMAPELARAGQQRVGTTIHAAVVAVRRTVTANTNLGIVLMLTPLARAVAVADATPDGLREPVCDVLDALDHHDAHDVYAAITLAKPGGLDERVEADVRDPPTIGLLDAMRLAAARDRIASEYVTGYAVTFERALPALERAVRDGLGTLDAVVELYLTLLAELPDTLIARKRGEHAAATVSEQAGGVLAAGGVRTAEGRRELAAFDAVLRSDDNALNPGTTADLVTAALFVAIVDRQI